MTGFSTLLASILLGSLPLDPAWLTLGECAARQSGECTARQHGKGDYDVSAYRLDLRIDPEREHICGTVAIELELVADGVPCLVFDLAQELNVKRARLLGGPLSGDSSLNGRLLDFEHRAEELHCLLPEPGELGQRWIVAIDYEGNPKSHDRLSGFHWAHDEQGNPWISTSCQIIGAHSWWPCKASFFEPADRCDRVWLNLTVPVELIAFANGRLLGTEPQGKKWKLWRWFYDYPISTYGVTLDIGKYALTETSLELEGLERPLEMLTCVLPCKVEAARTQFAEVPRLLEIYSRAFGPFPFPEAKIGIVQTCFIGMEHSSAIAYGSTFPTWLAEQGLADPAKRYNCYYDSVLVHQFAHEWWGNSVAAASWQDVWLHEGFATYAESLYLEQTRGREVMDEYFQGIRKEVRCDSSLMPASFGNFKEAYSSTIYYRGAWVLNTLRHFVDDDTLWFETLREFQARYRHGVASTDDFQEVLEQVTGREWGLFFEQWVRGRGFPRLSGTIDCGESGLTIDLRNCGTSQTGFELPLDLRWREKCTEVRKRVWLQPGANRIAIETERPAEGLQVLGLERVLCDQRIRVR